MQGGNRSLIFLEEVQFEVQFIIREGLRAAACPVQLAIHVDSMWVMGGGACNPNKELPNGAV
jgi:hypothetical protein